MPCPDRELAELVDGTELGELLASGEAEVTSVKASLGDGVLRVEVRARRLVELERVDLVLAFDGDES